MRPNWPAILWHTGCNLNGKKLYLAYVMYHDRYLCCSFWMPLFTTQTHVTHKCIPPDFYSQFHCTLPYSSAFNFMHPIDAIMHLHIIAHYKSLARSFLSIHYAVIRFKFKFLSLWMLNFRSTNQMHSRGKSTYKRNECWFRYGANEKD